MSDVLSQLGGFLNSGAGKAVEAGAVGGTGLIQSIMANREAGKKQKFVEDLITNPGKFNQFVAGFEKPLSAGLTADVARSTDAYGAERGLSSSPAIMKDVYAQALAPILQQQQSAATQAAMQSLGIYEQSPTTKPVDISGILKALFAGTGKPAFNPVVDQGVSVMQPSFEPGTAPAPPPPFDPTTGMPSGSFQLPPSLISSGGAGFDPTTQENG